MAFLKGLVSVLLVIATAAIGAMFALQNPTPVPLDLLIIDFAPRHMAVWILSALVLGAIIGLAAGSILLLKRRAQTAVLRRERDKLATEVERLRRLGVAERE